MAINQASRWLSRDMLLTLSGWRDGCSLSGALRPDAPKCTVYEQVRQLVNELGCCRTLESVVLACIIRLTEVVIS
jgi:hypothetical protein